MKQEARKHQPALALGWDVGGWMGKKQGIAACLIDGNNIRWAGTAQSLSFLSDIQRMEAPLPLQSILHKIDPSLEVWAETGEICIGVDAPLGWPRAFEQMICGNETAGKLSFQKEIDNPYAYRLTERHIRRLFGKKPLSAVFDRIGNNASLAILHARRWNRENSIERLPFDSLEHTKRSLIEVYPALVKSSSRSEAREEIRPYLPSGIQAGGDDYDAVLCALYAASLIRPKAVPGLAPLNGPGKKDAELEKIIRKEGWIYYPWDSTSS